MEVPAAMSSATETVTSLMEGSNSSDGSRNDSPKLVMRASVIALADTEPTSNAVFVNSISMLLMSFVDSCADALPVNVSVAVVSEVRVMTDVRPLGTFAALWVIASPFDPAKMVDPGLFKVMVADWLNEPLFASASVKFRVLQLRYGAGVSVVVVEPDQDGPV